MAEWCLAHPYKAHRPPTTTEDEGMSERILCPENHVKADDGLPCEKCEAWQKEQEDDMTKTPDPLVQIRERLEGLHQNLCEKHCGKPGSPQHKLGLHVDACCALRNDLAYLLTRLDAAEAVCEAAMPLPLFEGNAAEHGKHLVRLRQSLESWHHQKEGRG